MRWCMFKVKSYCCLWCFQDLLNDNGCLCVAEGIREHKIDDFLKIASLIYCIFRFLVSNSNTEKKKEHRFLTVHRQKASCDLVDPNMVEIIMFAISKSVNRSNRTIYGNSVEKWILYQTINRKMSN